VTSLRDSTLENGKKFMIARATVVPEPRERQPEEEYRDRDGDSRDGDSFEEGSSDRREGASNDGDNTDSRDDDDADSAPRSERAPQLAFDENEEQ
jgi:hypothetical protein